MKRGSFVALLRWSTVRGRFMVPLTAIVALVAVACSSGDATPAAGIASPPPDTATTPAATSTPLPLVIPTATPTAALTDDDRAAVALMHRLFDFQRGPNKDVIRQMVELGHPGLVAALIEITVFSFDSSTAEPIAEALFQLTGEDLGGGFDSHTAWLVWLADHPEFEPIAGYDRWKGDFYGRIAGGLDSFLYEGVPSRIPLWAVQFGGVGKDGIPALDDPVFIPSWQAAYLDPKERVFGIVVNGEARAYPERIMRVHELSNDVVGGRPVALVY